MHIQVPQSFINNLRWEDLWYSPSWKEYIWKCRKEQMPDPKFDSLWEPGQADVVRGPIFSTISGQIVRIRKENVQSHISEDNVIRLPSGKKGLSVGIHSRRNDQSPGRTNSREDALYHFWSRSAFLYDHGIVETTSFITPIALITAAFLVLLNLAIGMFISCQNHPLLWKIAMWLPLKFCGLLMYHYSSHVPHC